MAKQANREAHLSTVLPNLPGWHLNPFLPVLISVANSIDALHRGDAILRLLHETLVSTSDFSSHEKARIMAALENLSWTKDELKHIVIDYGQNERTREVGFLLGAALKIGLGGVGATQETIKILEIAAKNIDAP